MFGLQKLSDSSIRQKLLLSVLAQVINFIVVIISAFCELGAFLTDVEEIYPSNQIIISSCLCQINESNENDFSQENDDNKIQENDEKKIIDAQDIDKLGQMSYVLCFGTLVSLYINEQVYSPSEHDGIHRLLIFPLLVGALISFAGMILNSYAPFRMALVAFRVLNILIFFIVSIAYFLKIYDIWKDEEELLLKKETPTPKH